MEIDDPLTQRDANFNFYGDFIVDPIHPAGFSPFEGVGPIVMTSWNYGVSDRDGALLHSVGTIQEQILIDLPELDLFDVIKIKFSDNVDFFDNRIRSPGLDYVNDNEFEFVAGLIDPDTFQMFHHWYRIPTPGPLVVLALSGAALGARRRRIGFCAARR